MSDRAFAFCLLKAAGVTLLLWFVLGGAFFAWRAEWRYEKAHKDYCPSCNAKLSTRGS